jgi:hypothetical protein
MVTSSQIGPPIEGVIYEQTTLNGQLIFALGQGRLTIVRDAFSTVKPLHGKPGFAERFVVANQ